MSLPVFLLEQFAQSALAEDLAQGDVTTEALTSLFIQHGKHGSLEKAVICSRQAGVLSGLQVAEVCFRLVNPNIVWQTAMPNGQSLLPGSIIATLTGPLADILKAERTALNFLQHLSGIATTTAAFVDAIKGTGARMTDTRKTTPGLRRLERLAVIDGGGFSHRDNLASAVMLKDNHIAAAGGITAAVSAIRQRASHTLKIEVECDTLAQVAEALAARADIILLDNMSLADLRQAVVQIGTQAMTEASGGVTLNTVRAIAETGVQVISTSQLTLGAPALDIGLDLV